MTIANWAGRRLARQTGEPSYSIDSDLLATCPVIGQGAQSTVYCISDEQVAKHYVAAVEDSVVEREHRHTLLARLANIPTWRTDAIVRRGPDRILVGSLEMGIRLATVIRRYPLRSLRLMTVLGQLHASIHESGIQVEYRVKLAREDDPASVLAAHISATLVARIRDLVRDGEIGFCHADLSTSNVLVQGNKLKVLDWARSGQMAFAADVGRTNAFLLALENRTLGLRWLVGSYHRYLSRKYVRSYVECTGRSEQTIQAWTAIILARKMRVSRTRSRRTLLRNEMSSMLKKCFQDISESDLNLQ